MAIDIQLTDVESTTRKKTNFSSPNDNDYPTTKACDDRFDGLDTDIQDLYNTKQDANAAAGGDLSGTYPSPQVLNSAVLAKLLTGLNITGSSIAATDNLLQAFGKLQNQINGVLGGAIYQGVYNATTNSPTLVDGTGTKGHYYVASVAGTQNFGSGAIIFNVGDWVIYNGTIWQKVDNTDAVSSVNGFIGAVNLTTADIAEVTNLYFTTARVLATQLSGFVSGAGTVSATDTILQAIQKLNGNILAITKASISEINTGSNDTKFTTPAGLEGSKYLDQNGAKIYSDSSGTNTYTIAPSPALAAYSKGQSFNILFGNANTGACTLNVNSLGAKALLKQGSAALVSGDIPANTMLTVVYDGTSFLINSPVGVEGDLVDTLGFSTTTNFLDSTTYYFGFRRGEAAITSSNNALSKLKKPTTIIKTVIVQIAVGASNGSNEVVPLYLRKNNTTDLLVGNLDFSLVSINSSYVYAPFTVSITLLDSDTFEAKFVVPAMATNVAAGRMQIKLYE